MTEAYNIEKEIARRSEERAHELKAIEDIFRRLDALEKYQLAHHELLVIGKENPEVPPMKDTVKELKTATERLSDDVSLLASLENDVLGIRTWVDSEIEKERAEEERLEEASKNRKAFGFRMVEKISGKFLEVLMLALLVFLGFKDYL